MNEALFVFHIALAFALTLFCLRKGEPLLTLWTALLTLFANLFIAKQTTLFGWVVTTSDVYIIASFTSLNLLQEFFGKESAKRAATLSLALLVAFALLSRLHILYTPPTEDSFHSAYLQIFSPSLRIALASLVTLFIVQRVDLAFFSAIRNSKHISALPLRSALSLTLSQALDTALFTFLALAGTLPHLGQMAFGSFAIKLIAIALSSPLLAACKPPKEKQT